MTRPRVTLKLATSLDGRIATASGESRWITGPEAREQVHRLRAEHGAVLVGIDTVLADDPELSVRLPGYTGPQPIRIVLDSSAKMPLDRRLARPGVPLMLYSTVRSARLSELGIEHYVVAATPDGRVDVTAMLKHLENVAHEARIAVSFDSGPMTVMIEGGGQVAASFLKEDLVDRIEWFRAPLVLGAEGRPGVGRLGLDALAAAPRFRRVAVQTLGPDLWESYERT